MDATRFKELEEVVSKGIKLNERIRGLSAAEESASYQLRNRNTSHQTLRIVMRDTSFEIRLENETARNILVMALRAELDDLEDQLEKLDINKEESVCR